SRIPDPAYSAFYFHLQGYRTGKRPVDICTNTSCKNEREDYPGNNIIPLRLLHDFLADSPIQKVYPSNAHPYHSTKPLQNIIVDLSRKSRLIHLRPTDKPGSWRHRVENNSMRHHFCCNPLERFPIAAL